MSLPSRIRNRIAFAAPGLTRRPGQSRSPRLDSHVVLVIEEAIPERDRHAGGLFIWQLFQLLVEDGLSVALLAHDPARPQPSTAELEALGVTVLPAQTDLGAWLGANDSNLAAVIVARPEMGRRFVPLVRRRTDAPLLYYTHDLHFLREQRRYETSHDPAALRESRRLLGIETRLFAIVDGIITPSPAEVPIIQAMAAGKGVHAVLPFAESTGVGDSPLESRRGSRSLVMVGGFRHLPNVDAALHLVQDVMPRVWAAIPDAQVLLVGGDPPAEVQRLAGERVEVLGHVPDLGGVYRRARMSVSPLRFGSGFKGKILSSLEAGLPVVTTSIGNEGIDLVSGRDALIADEPEALAEHVIALYRDDDLLDSLAAAGRQAALARFPRRRSREALRAALGRTAVPPDGGG